MSDFDEFFWWRAEALDTTLKTKIKRKDYNLIFSKYKQLAINVVFPRISSIFDPQAIFSVELLPSGGQAHQGARQYPAKQST